MDLIQLFQNCPLEKGAVGVKFESKLVQVVFECPQMWNNFIYFSVGGNAILVRWSTQIINEVQLGISTGINRFVVVVKDPDPIPDIGPDLDPDPIPDIGPDLDPARMKGIVQKKELVFKVLRVSLFNKFFLFLRLCYFFFFFSILICSGSSYHNSKKSSRDPSSKPQSSKNQCFYGRAVHPDWKGFGKWSLMSIMEFYIMELISEISSW